MLINDEADSRHSAVVELIISAVLVLAVGVGVYQIQHPHTSHLQPPATAVLQR